ncbi:MAG: ATP-binding protein [Flavobacteriaceae bacterium]|nr:ATP-binding protein [Flavobacteriaceae bacterium]
MKTCQFFIGIILVPLFLGCTKSNNYQSALPTNIKKTNDSIFGLVRYKERKRTEKAQRKEEINKAFFLLQTARLPDSTRQYLLNSLSLETTDRFPKFFLEINDMAISLAKNQGDSKSLANLYWDRGYYYNKERDSALKYYYKAKQIFQQTKNTKLETRMELRIVNILTDIGAYKLSNQYCFKSIDKLQSKDNSNLLFVFYNQLGINYKNLGQLEISRQFYQKALLLAHNSKRKSTTYNNLASSLLLEGSYKEAHRYLLLALADSHNLKNSNLPFHKYRGNLGLALYHMGKKEEGVSLLKSTIEAMDSISNNGAKDIQATNLIRLANIYTSNKDTTQAIALLKKSIRFSKQAKNHRDHMHGLILLSKLDKTNGNQYFEDYRKTEDSINEANDSTLSHFNRIRYETDQIIAKNEVLTERVLLFILIAILLAVLSLSIYYYLGQKAKNTKLRLEKEQQESSQEIYKLLLAQQYKFEEGKALEKKRISEELHDGVLGRLFGTRLSLGVLNSSNSEDAEKKRQLFIEEIKNIEEDIRNISHDLSNKFEAPEIDFAQFLRKYLETNCEAANIHLTFHNDVNIDWQKIDGHTKINLYRILQEANKNTIKYANAKTFKVAFSKKESYISLVVSDDGHGYDVKQQSKGIGLKNMKSRVKKIGGSLTIQSSAAKGTALTIVISKIPNT